MASERLDLDSFIQRACELAVRTLGVPIAKVLQLQPEGDLLLRAAVGLDPALAKPGVTRIPGNPHSAAGYAIYAGLPVISDVESEARFIPSGLVVASGVKTTANVLIMAGGEPFGVLEVDSRERHSLDEDDVDFLQGFADLLGSAVERQQAVTMVEALSLERAVLMRELQHRVKNDLQVITSLLHLESRQAKGEEARETLARVGTRVDALRLVHDRLYAAGGVGRLELGDYVEALCRSRFQLHGLEPDGPISLRLDLSPAWIDHARAVPLGLIANEFLTNSFKHAFPGGCGTVSVELRSTEGARAVLVLSDDGVGMPREGGAGGGTGMSLVSTLARQIGAEARWEGGQGSRLCLSFAV